jgi:transcriptional regulator with XRE-family HTH domain
MNRFIERERVQDELIFNVTEDLLIAMEDSGVSKAELARRLNKSKSRVSQMLSGEANITLRTLASMCFELGVSVDFRIGNEFSVRDPRSDPEWSGSEGCYFDEWTSDIISPDSEQYLSMIQAIDFDGRTANDSFYRFNDSDEIAEAQ